MGQSITGGIEKEEINLDYQTHGREGDVDYVMDPFRFNGNLILLNSEKK